MVGNMSAELFFMGGQKSYSSSDGPCLHGCYELWSYGRYEFIAEAMYNLSSTKLLLLLVDTKCASKHKHKHLYCTVQDLKYASCSKYQQVSFHEMGCLSVTFGGAPGSNVDDSLDGDYLGPFMSLPYSVKPCAMDTQGMDGKLKEIKITPSGVVAAKDNYNSHSLIGPVLRVNWIDPPSLSEATGQYSAY